MIKYIPRSKVIVLLALMVTMLVAVDEALAAIPFLQLVSFMITYIYVMFGFTFTIATVGIYVVIDCLISGGMWPLFISIPSMWLAWLSLICLLHLSSLVRSNLYKKMLVIIPAVAIHGFIYGQTFAIINTLIYHGISESFYNAWLIWVLADIPWEVAQCVVGSVSVALLLPLTYKVTHPMLEHMCIKSRTLK